jgi:hypothetical protein
MSDDVFNMRGDKVTSYVMFTFANSCMPTLLNEKPSSLVCFQKKYIEDKESFFLILKEESGQFKCYYKVLYENETAFYVIIYQREFLKKVLDRYCNNGILKENGYRKGQENFDYNLLHFKVRFQCFKENKRNDFPHEVGIFLGYPIIDVEEFIKNKGENYMLCGYWKVYHNVEEAGRTFELFRRQRENAMELFFAGRDLRELVLSA